MEIKFSSLNTPEKGSLTILVGDDLKLSPLAASLDKNSDGIIAKAIKTSDFKGKKGKGLSIIAPAKSKLDYIVLFGSGGKKDLAMEADLQGLGGSLYANLNGLRIKSAAVAIEAKGKFSAGEIAAHMALGLLLRSYRFDK